MCGRFLKSDQGRGTMTDPTTPTPAEATAPTGATLADLDRLANEAVAGGQALVEKAREEAYVWAQTRTTALGHAAEIVKHSIASGAVKAEDAVDHLLTGANKIVAWLHGGAPDA